MDIFNNYTQRSTITSFNGSSFISLCGFGMFNSVNTSYYVSDYSNNRVYKLSDTWGYVSFKYFLKPVYIRAISNDLYISADFNIFKTDNKLNVLNQYNSTGILSYRGIYYNPDDTLIYITSYSVNVIHVFDLNLFLNDSISTSTYTPYAIVCYVSQLYVGTSIGVVLVIANKIIINTFNGCLGNSGYLNNIKFDQFGYMITTCYFDNRIYLYNSNGTYAGKSLATATSPFYTEFDSLGRFVLVTMYQVSLHY